MGCSLHHGLPVLRWSRSLEVGQASLFQKASEEEGRSVRRCRVTHVCTISFYGLPGYE
jgi:hypothetical protein